MTNEARQVASALKDFRKIKHTIEETVIFLDWVGEIHTTQSQWLAQRQRTKMSIISFNTLFKYQHRSMDLTITDIASTDRTRALLESISSMRRS